MHLEKALQLKVSTRDKAEAGKLVIVIKVSPLRSTKRQGFSRDITTAYLSTYPMLLVLSIGCYPKQWSKQFHHRFPLLWVNYMPLDMAVMASDEPVLRKAEKAFLLLLRSEGLYFTKL